VIAQWGFDEPSGQIAHDDGPFALDGGLGRTDGPDAGDPARIAGRSGGALHFDGTALVRLPDSSALAPEALTAEAVVRAAGSPGAYRYIVSRGGRGCVAGASGLYSAADGGLALYVFDGSRYVVSASAQPADVWDGRWHHVAGTFDGAALRLYVDGRPVGEPMAAALRIDYASTSPTAHLGQYGGDCDLAFSGDLDLVRLSSNPLSAEAVAAAAGEAASAPAPAGSTAPLWPAAPGTILPGPGPAAPRPAGCTVTVARKRVKAARRIVVQARVADPRRGQRQLRLVAHRVGGRRSISSARVGAGGRARLVLKRPHRGLRVVIRVQGRPGCAPARVNVS
jgi:hypothetical protein